ncbi:flagellar assembly protein FliW [Lutispora sp.]|uniref:flagellar assembly protein FliW n=1 Tax=Lutispora sp. TaxID=2828727 RepID=UPI002B21D999|nr:flagellar assembly protein FliW [Lutispora sp.]MEA4962845.1 flagellar assembly protein FliW [Lutispora sp.]
MKVKTRFFGEVNIDEDQIISFVEGIPGFPEQKKYIILNDDDTDFTFLQSTEEEGLCFITLPPAMIVGDYSFDISDETVEKLELKSPEDVLTLAILNIPEDFKKMTANLRAPIVINTKNKIGVQELLNDDNYSMKHQVFRRDV